jgi:peptidoglycan/LPS O-acetylase OafA/YrhL
VSARALRFPLVDSLRAFACLWVVVFHAAFVTGFVAMGTIVQGFLAFAGTAAMLFFAISGFLLYRPFARAHITQEERPDVSR